MIRNPVISIIGNYADEWSAGDQNSPMQGQFLNLRNQQTDNDKNIRQKWVVGTLWHSQHLLELTENVRKSMIPYM